MKRKIYQTLLNWKQEEQGKKALMVDGARRVGKSYIMEAFNRGEVEQKLYAVIFEKIPQQIREATIHSVCASFLRCQS